METKLPVIAMSEFDWALFCWCGERFAALSADWDAELAGWEWAWEWRTTAATHAGAHYLALAPQLRACSAALADDAELAELEEADVLACDAATLASDPPASAACEWELHIVYSATWAAPLLQFRARSARDGVPLRADDDAALARALPKHGAAGEARAALDAGNFVSLEEHPALGVPMAALHPCRTAQRMAELARAAPGGGSGLAREAYLLSWFAMVAPTLGFGVPARLALRMSARLGAMRDEGDQPLEARHPGSIDDAPSGPEVAPAG